MCQLVTLKYPCSDNTYIDLYGISLLVKVSCMEQTLWLWGSVKQRPKNEREPLKNTAIHRKMCK